MKKKQKKKQNFDARTTYVERGFWKGELDQINLPVAAFGERDGMEPLRK